MNTANLTAILPQFRFTLPARLTSMFKRIGAAEALTANSCLGLDQGATRWIDYPMGRTVTCEVGTLWLTFDNEPADVILEAGQSHRCAKASKLAIHGLSAARVWVN